MKDSARWFLGFTFLALACGAGLQGFGQTRKESKEALANPATAFRAVEGFQSSFALKTKGGVLRTVKVGMHTWSIDGASGRQNIRVTDFTLFHVRGGKIRVFSDGKEETKSTDMYWTLPAGTTLTLQVKGETALLDAMMVSSK